MQIGQTPQSNLWLAFPVVPNFFQVLCQNPGSWISVWALVLVVGLCVGFRMKFILLTLDFLLLMREVEGDYVTHQLILEDAPTVSQPHKAPEQRPQKYMVRIQIASSSCSHEASWSEGCSRWHLLIAWNILGEGGGLRVRLSFPSQMEKSNLDLLTQDRSFHHH